MTSLGAIPLSTIYNLIDNKNARGEKFDPYLEVCTLSMLAEWGTVSKTDFEKAERKAGLR